MTDYFELLGLERKPWVEGEVVKGRFLELSAGAHPDKAAGSNERFAELNKAAAVLREPKERLQHLLELEGAASKAATASLSNELMNLFGKVASVAREADGFLAERARVVSPILQAQLFGIGLELTERIEGLQRELGAMREGADSELKRISEEWPGRKPLGKLQSLAHTYATLQRWEGQLQERFAGLAAG